MTRAFIILQLLKHVIWYITHEKESAVDKLINNLTITLRKRVQFLKTIIRMSSKSELISVGIG